MPYFFPFTGFVPPIAPKGKRDCVCSCHVKQARPQSRESAWFCETCFDRMATDYDTFIEEWA